MLRYAFCLLLLGMFANCDKTPPYYLQAQIDVNDSLDILDNLILSSDANNEIKRQYVKFVHVIYKMGVIQSGCMRENYEQHYKSNVMQFIPEAIENLQLVVDEVRNKKEEFLKSTQVIRFVISKECLPIGDGSNYSDSRIPRCDEKIQEYLDSDSILKGQANILLAAGKAAKSFLARHKEFLESCQTHTAKSYIIDGASKLKQVIMDVGQYLRVSRENQYGTPKC